MTNPTITFTLPTYAPGDPKAGQAVNFGDVVWPLDPEWHGIVNHWDSIFFFVSIQPDGQPLFYYRDRHVPEYGEFEPGSLFYSTEEARDEAAEKLSQEHCK